MKRTIVLALSALGITGLLSSGSVPVALAQEPAAGPTELAVACEANAPDEATLGLCLVIAHGVLERSAPAVEPTSVFNDGLGALIGGVTLLGDKWLPYDTVTGRALDTKRKWDARRAHKLASRQADRLSALLLGTNPDTCSLAAYAKAWDLTASFRAYEAGAGGAARHIGRDAIALFTARRGAQECAAAAGQPGALKVAAANDAFHRLLAKRLIDFRRSPGGMALTLTAKGEMFAGSDEVPTATESEAGRDFLLSLWAAYEQAKHA